MKATFAWEDGEVSGVWHGRDSVGLSTASDKPAEVDEKTPDAADDGLETAQSDAADDGLDTARDGRDRGQDNVSEDLPDEVPDDLPPESSPASDEVPGEAGVPDSVLVGP